ncbi:MAG: HPr kinase/phosphatase C-terminal domain-containing protein [Pseudomonadota bacterium]
MATDKDIISSKKSIQMHGTCIAIDDKAIVLRGASGSGKSDLALRFIHTPFPRISAPQNFQLQTGRLVADDQVLIHRNGEDLIASCPKQIQGMIEIRGVGLVAVPYLERARIYALVDLVALENVPRLPDDPIAKENLLDVTCPVFQLYSFEASAPFKLWHILGQ